MSWAARVSREAVERKPKHGQPCTHCGVCCQASLCDLAQAVFGRRPGPCPALEYVGNNSRCGLFRFDPESVRFLIGNGTGCDSRIGGEATDDEFNKRLAQWDIDNEAGIRAAKAKWGMI